MFSLHDSTQSMKQYAPISFTTLSQAGCLDVVCLPVVRSIATSFLPALGPPYVASFRNIIIPHKHLQLLVPLQEVDRIEQQSAQCQFRLDELEQDFDASGNRFPSLEKSLRRCIRVLRDLDSDISYSSSSSSEG